MPIYFKDAADEIHFEYRDALPGNSMILRINKNEPAYKINIAVFHLYRLYRDGLYNSYKEKSDTAPDIMEHKLEYKESDESKLSKNPKDHEPLHHYTVATSLFATKERKESNGKMKSYLAYQYINGQKTNIGFVDFIEKTIEETVDRKPIVYIATAAVVNRGQGVGRRLMECVFSHYPAGTEFYILTRVFNTEAKDLYGKRFKFDPISASEIEQLHYDNRYCGFKHTSTPTEVAAIQAKKMFTPKTDNQPKLTSQTKLIKYGLFAATAAVAGLLGYRIFTHKSPNNPAATAKPGW